jgi:hypothetical protein
VQELLNVKKILKKNSTKSKLNILWKVRQALGSVRKPLLSEISSFLGGDFVIFRPTVRRY